MGRERYMIDQLDREDGQRRLGDVDAEIDAVAAGYPLNRLERAVVVALASFPDGATHRELNDYIYHGTLVSVLPNHAPTRLVGRGLVIQDGQRYRLSVTGQILLSTL